MLVTFGMVARVNSRKGTDERGRSNRDIKKRDIKGSPMNIPDLSLEGWGGGGMSEGVWRRLAGKAHVFETETRCSKQTPGN